MPKITIEFEDKSAEVVEVTDAELKHLEAEMSAGNAKKVELPGRLTCLKAPIMIRVHSGSGTIVRQRNFR